MDRNILFKCPTTGMNVQHSLSGDAAGSVETHVMVCAPPARRCILVDAATGRLLGDRSGAAASRGRSSKTDRRPT
jgi:hypothetical protein